MAKAMPGRNERARLHVGMMLVIVLRKAQRHGTVGFTINKLLHFGIRAGSNFVRMYLAR